MAIKHVLLFRPWDRRSIHLALAGCAVAMLACGSGAIERPDDAIIPTTTTTDPTATTTTTSRAATTTTTAAPTTTDTTAGDDDDDEYTWGLPFGDETISINEDVLYRIIQKGDCKEAQTFLDENWRSLLSPRAVLLYQAGVLFCAGQTQDAGGFFEQAEREYGWAGVSSPYLDCNIYQAAASMLRQQPPTNFPCATGTAPKWPSSHGEPRDDPRTPEDETIATSNENSTTTSTTTNP